MYGYLTKYIFQGYKIQAWRWDETENANVEQKLMSVPPNLLDPLTEQSAVIGGLEKFTEYNISVLCFTEPGDGPRSEFVLVRTKEDCEFNLFILTIFLCVIIIILAAICTCPLPAHLHASFWHVPLHSHCVYANWHACIWQTYPVAFTANNVMPLFAIVI